MKTSVYLLVKRVHFLVARNVILTSVKQHCSITSYTKYILLVCKTLMDTALVW